MAEAFDPYHIWLGIPPEDQPPHHYRLLGVKAFETNPDVLESAADQRMSHLRSFQTGKHAAESQKLLNELAAARLCLLSPEKRPAYDRELHDRLALEKPPTAPLRPTASKPLAVAKPLIAKPAEPATSLGFDPLELAPARRSSKRRRPNQSPAIYAVAGVGLIAVVAVAWIAIGSGGSNETSLAARNPAAPPTAADAGSSRDDESAPVRPARVPPKTASKPVPAQHDPEAATDPNDSSPPDEEQAAPVDKSVGDMSAALPEDAAETAAEDRPEPPGADQLVAAVAEIQRVLHDDYAAAKKPAEKAALAEKLFGLVPDSSTASERFALLSEARRLAIAAGNSELAMQAADALAENFAVDRFELLAKTAEELAARDLSPAARKELAEAIEPLVDAALAASQFAQGRRLAAVGLAAARKAKQPDATKTFARRAKELAAGEKLATSAAEARIRLEQNPDDPAADQTLGKYLCLYVGNWPAGVPHLVRSDDPAWRAVAELEAAGNPSPSAAVKLGDAWWELAEHGGPDADRMRARAGHWYQQAVAGLTGLSKTRAEKRLEEIGGSQPSGNRQVDKASGGVVADKLVVWNCHNNIGKDRGMLSCNVELRKADKVVWSKKAIKLAWSKDEELATTIPLPKIPFDALRVASDTFQDFGPALCEVEIFRGNTNIARGKPVAASGFYNPPPFLPAAVVDGVRDSSQHGVGYWLAPNHQPGWVEVQVTSPMGSAGKIVYLADLPASETQLHPETRLLQPEPVGGVVSPHGLFMHALHNSSSHAAFTIDKEYQSLSGMAAISEAAGDRIATPLTFRIVGDGKELWRATLQKAGATQPLNVRVRGVSKLELFVDCPGNGDWGKAEWVDLELTRAGAAPASSSTSAKPLSKIGGSPSSNVGDGVIADKLVVWNCNSKPGTDRGMLSCNVELRKAGEVVWSKKRIELAWNYDEEPATTISLPKTAFDALRIETVAYHARGPALCEVEVLQGSTNLAQGKPVTSDGDFDPRFPAAAVVDGIKNSAQFAVGYWAAPERHRGWVEVQVAPLRASDPVPVERPAPEVGHSQPRKTDAGVTANNLLLWNCHCSGKDRGMLGCNIELRKGGKVVWTKKLVQLDWSADAEPSTEVALPNISFDAVRVGATSHHGSGPALCEIEILRGDENLATGKPVVASGSSPLGGRPEDVVDGARDSGAKTSGFWAAPDNQPQAWIEVQIVPPNAKGNEVTITTAVFGIPGKQADVTERLQKAIGTGPFVAVQADDRLFGDPAPGEQKRLVVTGRIGTSRFSLDLAQSEVAPLPSFPVEGLRVPGASNGFSIVAARYGAGVTWTDIADAVAKAIHDTTASFNTDEFSKDLPDPWFGVNKHVVIWFDNRGLRYVRVFGPSETHSLLP